MTVCACRQSGHFATANREQEILLVEKAMFKHNKIGVFFAMSYT
jgi:hypothetical protein